MLYFLISLLHIAICVALIFFVLIQSNKGMGLAGAFGSMGGAETFGTSGGVNILMKITISLAVLFAVTSLTLSFMPPPSRTAGGIMAEQSNATGAAGNLQDLLNQSQQDQAAAQSPAEDQAQADAIRQQPQPNQPVPQQGVGVDNPPAQEGQGAAAPSGQEQQQQ